MSRFKSENEDLDDMMAADCNRWAAEDEAKRCRSDFLTINPMTPKEYAEFKGMKEITTPKQALELEIIALFTGLGVKHVSCVTNEMSGGQHIETAYICHWNNQQYGEMRAEDVAHSMLWMLQHVWRPIHEPELTFAVLPGKEGKGFTVWYRWLEDENDEQSE